MEKLSQEFLDSCGKHKGRIMRGEAITRIETFVDAAFAFSLTMMVISIDSTPSSAPELVEISRDIPAYLASALLIGLIWRNHNQWSRTFGIQDDVTIFLSLSLVMLVLIFIYPLKLIFMSLFTFLSDGYLSPGFNADSWAEVSTMFIFFSIGFACVSTIMVLLYFNAMAKRDLLGLTELEWNFCRTAVLTNTVTIVTAFISILLAMSLQGSTLTLAGYIYVSLFVTQPLARRIYNKKFRVQF